MPEIAHFNDSIRDAIKGSTWGGQESEPGFVNGATGKEALIAKNLLAGSLRDQGQGIYDFAKPGQVIQYAEAHDNLTLWDKLSYSNPTDSDQDKKKMQKMATSMVLLSQGVPFIHAGQEFFRTKDRDENSYQSSDAINKLDWERYAENIDSVQDIEAVMQLRNSEPLFRLTNYTEINQKMKIIKQDENVVAYELKDGATSYVVLFNANKAEKEVVIPANKYWARIGETTTDLTAETSTVKVGALSTLVLKNGEATFEIEASAGAGGTITPSGKQAYAAGEKPSYKVSADAGYRVQQVSVDGKAVTLSGDTYTFEALTAGHIVEAIFEVIPQHNKMESLDKISLPLAELVAQPGQNAKERYLLQKLAAHGYYQLEGDTEQHDLDIVLTVANLDWETPKVGVYEGVIQFASEMQSRAVGTTKPVQITLTAAAPAPGEIEVVNPVKPTNPPGKVDGGTTTIPPKKRHESGRKQSRSQASKRNIETSITNNWGQQFFSVDSFTR